MESYQQERWDRLGPEASKQTNLTAPEEKMEDWRRRVGIDTAGISLTAAFHASSQTKTELFSSAPASTVIENDNEEAA